MQVTSDVIVIVLLPEGYNCQVLFLINPELTTRTDRFVAFLAVKARTSSYVWLTVTVVQQFNDLWGH